jgi:hypothetical protein
MKQAILKNYLTTIFGILAGLPALVVQSMAAMNVPLPATWSHILLLVGALGLIGLGVCAKAFNVNSTQAQVDKATTDAAK